MRSRLSWARCVVVFGAILLGGLLFLPSANRSTAGVFSPFTEYRFHHDPILGTSLDLVVLARSEADAEACETAVLDEIERLRRILSTYDPETEISRLNRSTGPVVCAEEILDVLRAYEVWNHRSHGASNGQLGELIRTWKEAERTQTLPDAGTLARLVAQVNQPAYRIDEGNRTVQKLTQHPLNVNSIGKGYIIGKAAEVARAKVPSVRAILLNIGGDMLAVGDWQIGVADPRHPQDNEKPLTSLRLHDAAVATSAGYARGYTIGGRRYSHILDPRTGRPAEGVASATVVAPDNVTANALATTLCVLSPEEGLALLREIPGARGLIITPDGTEFRSEGFDAMEVPPGMTECADGAANPWPEGYQAVVNLELTMQKGFKVRRPYVAVWVEDGKGNPVRTLSVWGNEPKYQRALTNWWKFAKDDRDLIKSVTRATRAAGKYDLVWDGKDDKGKAVDRGTYTIVVEVNREHGKHIKQTAKVECGADKASATLEKSSETEESKVEYGPRGK